MNNIEKKEILEGLKVLLIIYTTKCESIKSGLCLQAMMSLDKNAYITHAYIKDNKPKIFQKHFSIYSFLDGYYWMEYLTKPRIKWLRYHINKLEKELL